MSKQRQAWQPPETDCDTLHLGCGEDYHADAWNVDANADVAPDELVDLNEIPWPWTDGSASRIRAYHVFEHLTDIEGVLRECARVLESGGRLETRWPIGVDAIADPDHEHVWTWRTPAYYCGKRHWDIDVGLDVVHRDVRLWSHHPVDWIRRLHTWWLQRLVDRHGAGAWCFNLGGMSGEFTVVFEKP